jgi:hypothetical protein
MRIGNNPQKSRQFVESEFFHQVIVPVYIPNEEGYFKESLHILQLCLESLFRSSHPKTFITVVNNGSCSKVADYLDKLFQSGAIHELMHTANIGKVNAVFKGLTGHSFPLITITDADVLFLNGWQKGSYTIFDALPKAGAVCTTPLSRRLKYLTTNIFFDYLFSKKLQFTPVENPEAIKEFARSIEDEGFIRPVHLKSYLTITENNVRAIVGAGHFVCTYKGDIFEQSRFNFSEHYLGSDALCRFIDEPVVKKGYWRLSTEENYTYHMGNVSESWMDDKLAEIQPQGNINQPMLPEQNVSALSWYIKGVIFPKIIFKYSVWKKFLRHKGLTKTEAGDY